MRRKACRGAERSFADLRLLSQPEHGVRFAAMKYPATLAGEIRASFTAICPPSDQRSFYSRYCMRDCAAWSGTEAGSAMSLVNNCDDIAGAPQKSKIPSSIWVRIASR